MVRINPVKAKPGPKHKTNFTNLSRPYCGVSRKRQVNTSIFRGIIAFDFSPLSEYLSLFTHPNAVCQIQKDKLSWNFEKVHQIIDRCNSKNKILAYLAGHHHGGGYFYDKKRKIHHVTMKSMLENTETNAFGVLEFYKEYAVLRGFGAVISRLMRYNDGIELKMNATEER